MTDALERPLAGRRILVTGGSSGIGRALTRRYAHEGAQVWPVGRRAGALADTIAGLDPTRVRAIPADLTRAEDRRAIARTIGEASGGLDVVVHAAGILGPPATPLAVYPEQDWRQVFEINLHAVHLLHQLLDPLLHAGDVPTVIGVSSTVGRKGRAGWGAYAVSKFALEGWLETLADEWQEVGRVYSVNPGGTRTPMRALARPDEDPSTLPTPDDIAPLFLRLAHPGAPEPSGAKLEARDWIGRDPWDGLAHTSPRGADA